MRSRTSSLPNVLLRVLALLAACGGLVGLISLLSTDEASAVIERIYTLPFRDTYTIGYGFGGYPGHQGTDYFIGAYSSGGEPVVAAKEGTARLYQQFPGAGLYVIIDHGNGHKTRYMHLSTRTVSDSQYVARGMLVGYEGNTGVDDGSYHLHFETRHDATAGDCCSGTAVDPYAPATYMWTTNPPDTACEGGGPWRPSQLDWEGLGGSFTSAPAAVSWDCSRLDVFARGLGPTYSIFHKTWDGSSWRPSPSDWENLGGGFTTGPAAVSWGFNRLDIFAVGLGPNYSMFHKAW